MKCILIWVQKKTTDRSGLSVDREGRRIIDFLLGTELEKLDKTLEKIKILKRK